MRTTFINRIKALAFGLPLMFIMSLTGCVEDDLSVCGISVNFVYDKNVDRVDKFATNVDKITLFVYDSQGNYVGEYASEGNKLHSGPIKLNLMEGEYTLVAWGNLCDDYELADIASYEAAVLSLRRANDTIMNRPGDLSHGELSKIQVRADLSANQTDTIYLTKNTNNIVVTTVGMPYSETSKTKYDCYIVSRNGDYKFDNLMTGADRLHYIPEASINGDEEKVSDFIILRELNDKTLTNSRIFISRTTEGEGTETLVARDLTDILLPIAITGDLDIDDYFEIELEITETNGTTTIRINDWKVF